MHRHIATLGSAVHAAPPAPAQSSSLAPVLATAIILLAVLLLGALLVARR